jgi:hypothetical protein
MRVVTAVLFVISFAAVQAGGTDNKWYIGDERCPPPKDDGVYSAPYNALEHQHEYPVFTGADKPGWSCSYQREDGVVVQYGDSRTPQQQWLAIWGDDEDR